MRSVYCAVAGLSLACHVSILTADDQTHDAVLAEARAALGQYYSSIRSLDVTLEATFTSPDATHKSQVQWYMDGSRKAVLNRTIPLGPSAPPAAVRGFHSQYDGKAYSVNSWWEEPEWQPAEIYIRIGQPIQPGTLTSESAYRMAGFGILDGESLGTLIQRPEVVVDGSETVHGADCWRVILGTTRFGRENFQEHSVVVWLDPAVGFLMRKISIMPTRALAVWGNPEAMRAFTFQSGETTHSASLDSFQTIDDPVLGQRWFPDRLHAVVPPGKVTHAHHNFVNVSVNRFIERERFLPLPVFGTRTITVEKDGRQTTSYTGGEEGKREFLRRLEKEHGQSQPAPPSRIRPLATGTTNVVDARSDSSWNAQSWLILMAAICGIGGAAVWWKRRRLFT
ncbi:hypothetical protein GC176_27760 [bacterium]|nr:hypothetical protein [bacterium]